MALWWHKCFIVCIKIAVIRSSATSMRKILFGALVSVFFFTYILPATPAAAQSGQDFSERGEWMMDMMLGSRHEDFDKELESRYGAEFMDRMHDSMGQMAFRGGMMGGGFVPAGMMGMMG